MIRLWDVQRLDFEPFNSANLDEASASSHFPVTLNTLRDHLNRVWTIAFSPDGQLLASGSNDQTVRLWDVRSHLASGCGAMRRKAERLQNILDAIAAIERYTSQERQAFKEQELIQVWVVHHLQIIGEAANSLSTALISQYSEVP